LSWLPAETQADSEEHKNALPPKSNHGNKCDHDLVNFPHDPLTKITSKPSCAEELHKNAMCACQPASLSVRQWFGIPAARETALDDAFASFAEPLTPLRSSSNFRAGRVGLPCNRPHPGG
jgi:hypothetical protein